MNGLKKFKAPALFDGYRLHPEPPVLVTREDGTIEALLQPREAGEGVEEVEGILCPGFINAHCHLELSHMKGKIPEATGLAEFVFKVVNERHLPDQEILQAIEKAEDEMLANGIVAAGDICNNALTIPQKLKGRIWYHNFIEASGFHPSVVEQRFQRSAGFFAAYSRLYSIPVESNSITPHAPYSVADGLWEKIIHFPGNHLFTIHNQESEAEDQWFINKEGDMAQLFAKMNIDVSHFQPSGKSSLQTYISRFLPNQTLILVHNVHTRQEDIAVARKSGRQLYWCLCPNANWYISRRLPDIDLLVREDCNIVLGTDSLASNHQLNLLEEMKTIQAHFPHIKTEQMLCWATSNAARALQVQPLMGSFEKGKKPGVLLIEPDLSGLKRLL